MSDVVYATDGKLAKRYDVVTKTIWHWAKFNPKFPKPIKINGCTRWLMSEIEAYERDLEISNARAQWLKNIEPKLASEFLEATGGR